MSHRNLPRLYLVFAAAAAVLVTSCGKKPPAAQPAEPGPAPAETEPATPDAAVADAPAQSPDPGADAIPTEPQATGSADPFESGMARILALEEDAEIAKALRQCRELRREFRNHPRVSELEELLVHLQEAKRASVHLAVAIRNLDAADAPIVQAARMELLDAGETGRIFLRRVVRTQRGRLVIEAARLLARVRDSASIDDAITRLGQEGMPDPEVEAVAGILLATAEAMTAEHLAIAQAMIRNDGSFARRHVAGALQRIVDDVCGSDLAAYDERAGMPGMAAELRDYIERAVTSDNPAVLAWVCIYGGSAAGYIHGIRGRFYHGRGFDPDQLATQRYVRTINFYNQNLSYPDKRYYNLSVRWDGYVDVPQDGEYILAANGDDNAKLWLDETRVLESARNRINTYTNTLAAGRHALRLDFVNVSSTADIDLQWSGPGISRTHKLPYRARPQPWFISTLKTNILTLGTNDLKAIQAAKRTIVFAGSVGDIFLRHAVVHAPGPLARQALRMLVDQRERRTPDMIEQRVKAGADDELMTALLEAMRDLAEQVDPNRYPALVEAIESDTGYSMTLEAVALCGVLERACGNDEQQFNQHIGSDTAYDTLRNYVETCLRSEKPDVVMRASALGAPFAGYMRGLKVEYYRGHSFDAHALTLLRPGIYHANRRFPYPDGRQDDIAVRWTGLLEIEKAGTYTFHLYSDAIARLRIADQVDLRAISYKDDNVTVNLEPGRYPLQCDMRQVSSNNRCELYWSGDVIGKRVLVPRTALLTRSWRESAEKVAQAITDVTSTNATVSGKARIRINHDDTVSRIQLYNAVRYAPDTTSLQAARILTTLRDTPSVSIMANRLLSAPGAATTALVDGLSDMAPHIDTQTQKRLYGAFADPGKRAKAGLGPVVPVGDACAAVVAAVFDRAYGSDPARLNKALDDPRAYDALKAYFGEQIVSSHATNVAYACEHGGSLVPRATGLHAQFYEGRLFDTRVQDSRVSGVNVANRSFPMPDRRQDYISARWTGWFVPAKAGAYTLALKGEDRAEVWIDGNSVLSSSRFEEKTAELTLPAAPHAIRIDHQQSTGNSRIELYWTGPGMPKTLIPKPRLRVNLWSGRVLFLQEAVRKLASPTAAVVKKSTASLEANIPISRIVAHNALRHADAAVAVAAGRYLSQVADPGFGPLTVQRLGAEPTPLMVTSLVSSLKSYTNQLDAAVLGGLYDLLEKDQKHDLKEALTLFNKILVKECDTKPDEFGKRLKNPKAYAGLQAYVTRGLKGDDKALAKWLASSAGALYPHAGLRGEYFSGPTFNTPYEKRIDEQVNLDAKTYPYPQKRPEQVSARWTGYLYTGKSGNHVFHFSGIGKTQLWINDKPVGNNAGVQLPPGAHDLKFEFSESTNATVSLAWTAPGIARQVIPKEALRAVPWK